MLKQEDLIKTDEYKEEKAENDAWRSKYEKIMKVLRDNQDTVDNHNDAVFSGTYAKVANQIIEALEKPIK